MPGTTPPYPWHLAKISIGLFDVLDRISKYALVPDVGQKKLLDSCRAEVEETRRQLAEHEAEQE